ncbi:MAG: hypothetical protein GF311_00070 [Candidatus Lokiarchaeota archaeon]|nr:hypothetical protein [Candidatus Lokiarchaeota archaeon]
MNKKNYKITILLIISILSTSLLIFGNVISVRATDFAPKPDQPNEDFSWNFTKGDLIGFDYQMFMNDTDMSFIYMSEMGGPQIFNITDFGYTNISGSFYYNVKAKQVFYNANKSIIEENPIATEVMFSCINFTNGEMYRNSDQIEGFLHGNIGINFFIPHNGTDLALEWCAYALNETTFSETFYKTMIEIKTETNEIIYTNSTTNDYIALKYYENGTLESMEMFSENGTLFPMQGLPQNTNLTYKVVRTNDFNPVDEVEWGIDIGDIYIYNWDDEIRKFEIVDQMEETFGTTSISEVRADSWILNASSQWDLLYKNGTVGAANEYISLPMGKNYDYITLPIDNNSQKNLMKMEDYFMIFPEISVITEGNSVKIINETTGGYIISQWSKEGVITHLKTEQLPLQLWNNNVTLLASNPDNFGTTIVDGEDSFQITDIGTGQDFDIDVDISVSEISQMMYSGSSKNSVHLKLNEALLFLDISLNKSDNLSNLNLTIHYNNQKYEDIEAWWFNQSADDGFGKWEKISYTDLGDGTITFSVDHLSLFSLSGSEIDQAPDGDDTPYIPFGYYFLIYLTIATILGIIHTARKKIEL